MEDMHRPYANTIPLYIRDLSIEDLVPMGVLEPILHGYQGNCTYISGVLIPFSKASSR